MPVELRLSSRLTLSVIVAVLLSASSALAGALEDGVAAFHRGDYATALRLFQPLAEQGDATAEVCLGDMYGDEGLGVARNPNEALKWYRKAADQGLAAAQAKLGHVYQNGRFVHGGIPQSYEEARKWYLKAAEQGALDAQDALGDMYLNGEGVPKDDEEAMKWYRSAADQGYPPSQFKLGHGYQHGIGVQQDAVLAYKWYNLDSASRGLRDLMASKMTPEQIAEAQRLSQEGKPTKPSSAPDPCTAACSAPDCNAAWYFLAVNRSPAVASNAPQPLAAQPYSIVVLPFANRSGDPGQDYLVDALTDGLTTRLARLRDTFVIARNTAFYKGKPVDAKAIGKDLGVRYVLEGSMLRIGDRMRVNAHLIDAGSGAQPWGIDAPLADLSQTQDAIVAQLANALDFFQFQPYDAARVSLPPAAANRVAEDLARQCDADARKAGWIGKEADAAFALCEEADAIDPNNHVHALMALGIKFLMPAALGLSDDPKVDLERADEFATLALSRDPDWTWNHDVKGVILRFKGRAEEAVAEHERALALDPSNVDAVGQLGGDYGNLGEFDKGLEYLDKAILANPYDPEIAYWYGGKAWDNFGLKRYDQAIELARQAIAIKPNYNQSSHLVLVAALALIDHDAEAREALQRYLALPSTGPLRTIAAWKAHQMSQVPKQSGDPRFVEMNERSYDGLRKAGMPEE